MKILYRISHTSYSTTKKEFIVLPSFRGEDFFSQSETRIAHGDHVFLPIGMKFGNLKTRGSPDLVSLNWFRYCAFIIFEEKKYFYFCSVSQLRFPIHSKKYDNSMTSCTVSQSLK
jgi:hypothetical protein